MQLLTVIIAPTTLTEREQVTISSSFLRTLSEENGGVPSSSGDMDRMDLSFPLPPFFAMNIFEPKTFQKNLLVAGF